MPHLQKKYYTDANGRKRIKGFYVTFKDASRSPARKQITLGTKDASAACAKLARLELEYAQGTFDPWGGKRLGQERITASEAVRRFLRSREESSGSSQGIATYRAVVEPFAYSLAPGLLITQVERRHVDTWLEAKSVSESTFKSYTDRLRIFAAWCVEVGLAPMSWQPVPKPKRGNQARREDVIRFFTEEQLRSIRNALAARVTMSSSSDSSVDKVLEDVIPFAAGTGLRRGEICALRWNAVHLHPTGGTSYVRVANTDSFTTKSGRERTVPLVGDALTAIESRRKHRRSKDPSDTVFPAAKGGEMNGGYIGKRFRMLLAEANLPGISAHNFHSLRHTFGTMAINRGVDVFQLKEIMGHADVKTTLKYAKLRPVTLAQAMQRAFGSGLDSEPLEGGQKEAQIKTGGQ